MALENKQFENHSGITFNVNQTAYLVESVNFNIEVAIAVIHANNVYPQGWSVSEANFGGTVVFPGNVRERIQAELTTDGVLPTEGRSITLVHEDDSTTTFTDVMITNYDYASEQGQEKTESEYAWIALGLE